MEYPLFVVMKSKPANYALYDEIKGYGEWSLYVLKDEHVGGFRPGAMYKIFVHTHDDTPIDYEISYETVYRWRNYHRSLEALLLLMAVSVGFDVQQPLNIFETDDLHDYRTGSNGRSFENVMLSELIDNCCGCGDNEMALRAVYNTFRAFRGWPGERLSENASVHDNPGWMFIAYLTEPKGLTEHGGSIGNAWFTDKGKLYALLLQQYGEWRKQEPGYDAW